MGSIPDRKIEKSALSGSLTRDGITLQVQIYRFADMNDAWTLEVLDPGTGHTLWDEAFADDAQAYEYFEDAFARRGIRSFTDEPALL